MKESSYLGFVLPTVIFLLVLTAMPIIATIFLSFTSFDIAHPERTTFIGLENYKNLLFDNRFLNSVKVTLLLIIIPVAIQMIFGLSLAVALNEKLKGTNWMRSVFLAPAILPPVVIGLIWKVFLIPQLGGLNYFLSLVGIVGPDWLGSPTPALWAVIIASIWTGTSFVALMYLSSLEAIPESLYEAASIDGSTWWQKLRFITMPMLKSVSKVIMVFRVLEALAIFPVVYVLTGGGPAGATEPINFYAYTVAFSYLRFDYSSTLIVVFFIFLLFVSLPILKSMVKR